MLKVNLTRVAIVPVAFALMCAISAPASAKKKAHPTYEQAWGICTKELDRNHIPRQDAGQRQAAGGACMHRYGYHL
ncbi:MAG: hypothetical protein WBW35_14115 [Xanthobacteraceae bacterium]